MTESHFKGDNYLLIDKTLSEKE